MAPAGNVFQYSYSPTTLGSLLTLGNARPVKSTAASVPLYISKYLLFELPSAYSENHTPTAGGATVKDTSSSGCPPVPASATKSPASLKKP